MNIFSLRNPGLLLLLMVCGTGPVLAQQDNRLLFELLNRIELLEQELRELRGEMEVFRYRQEQEGADLQALRQRLLELEGRGGAGAAPPPPPVAPPIVAPDAESPVDTPTVDATSPPIPREAPERPDTATVDAEPPPSESIQEPPPPVAADPPPRPRPGPPTADEQMAYDAAFGRLREGQYDQAVQAFQVFMQQYPESSLVPNAHYWLGEVYYVMREFDSARDTFIELGSRYPDNSRLPDALLKLGYIYEEQGDTARAREVYGKLMELYPGSRPADLAEQRLAVLP